MFPPIFVLDQAIQAPFQVLKRPGGAGGILAIDSEGQSGYRSESSIAAGLLGIVLLGASDRGRGQRRVSRSPASVCFVELLKAWKDFV